ncbi:MAG: hypothetical protein H6738_23420 [Alphaproteobacteria bacterium]|nr:hypothetical protein [Alphaproteobacteria bacterium]MCB9699756.1 hypothetical protein [Alphaproteobacteria bacterium]
MTFDLDTLKLAFTRTLLDELSKADKQLLDEEKVLVEQLAPAASLRAAGLWDDLDRPTAAWNAACATALQRLPRELPLDARLALVSSFLELCIVDGELHRDEGSLLFVGAKLLGIDAGTFNAHLESLTEHVGSVDLDEPS